MEAHRLVEKEDFRPNADGARDAEALLLAARQILPALQELVLHLVPQRHAPQCDQLPNPFAPSWAVSG